MTKNNLLKVYALDLEMQYAGGLCIVAARNKKEAVIIASTKDKLNWVNPQKLPLQTKLKNPKVIATGSHIE